MHLEQLLADPSLCRVMETDCRPQVLGDNGRQKDSSPGEDGQRHCRAPCMSQARTVHLGVSRGVAPAPSILSVLIWVCIRSSVWGCDYRTDIMQITWAALSTAKRHLRFVPFPHGTHFQKAGTHLTALGLRHIWLPLLSPSSLGRGLPRALFRTSWAAPFDLHPKAWCGPNPEHSYVLQEKLGHCHWSKSGNARCCCCLVAKSCSTICDPMDCHTPGFLVPHHLPEFAQVHVHWIGEAIQPSHPLSPSFPFTLLPSTRVFSNESAVHIRWPKHWCFSFNNSPSGEYSGLISFRIDCFDLLAVQGTLKSLLQHHSSKTSILRCSDFFMVQLSLSYMTTGKTIALPRQTFGGKVMSLLFT